MLYADAKLVIIEFIGNCATTNYPTEIKLFPVVSKSPKAHFTITSEQMIATAESIHMIPQYLTQSRAKIVPTPVMASAST